MRLAESVCLVFGSSTHGLESQRKSAMVGDLEIWDRSGEGGGTAVVLHCCWPDAAGGAGEVEGECASLSALCRPACKPAREGSAILREPERVAPAEGTEQGAETRCRTR